jgi:hypothetical protein
MENDAGGVLVIIFSDPPELFIGELFYAAPGHETEYNPSNEGLRHGKTYGVFCAKNGNICYTKPTPKTGQRTKGNPPEVTTRAAMC